MYSYLLLELCTHPALVELENALFCIGKVTATLGIGESDARMEGADNVYLLIFYP